MITFAEKELSMETRLQEMLMEEEVRHDRRNRELLTFLAAILNFTGPVKLSCLDLVTADYTKIRQIQDPCTLAYTIDCIKNDREEKKR